MLQPHTLAPTFVLASPDAEVDLAAFRQRQNLILLFVPAHQLEACAHALQAFQPVVPQLTELNTRLFVIAYGGDPAPSVDVASLPLLFDPTAEAASAFLGADACASARPALFVLDRYGEVWLAHVGTPWPAAREVLDTLEWVERQCPE